METVIDTSCLLGVILKEPRRQEIIQASRGCTLLAPDFIGAEFCSALSGLMRRELISVGTAKEAIQAFLQIPVQQRSADFRQVLEIASEHRMYAYDAFFLSLCVRHNAMLLTLDRKMAAIATNMNIKLLLA
jgi:predicted nucleic acid-binding protein